MRSLQDDGFVVIPGPYSPEELPRLSKSYDHLVSTALPEDIRIGSTTTRVSGLAGRIPELEALYLYRPLLEASRLIIGGPFKLSSLHARTLHPNTPKHRFHVDFKPDEDRFPLASFILMVDEFREDNGATGFVAGSHKWSQVPNELSDEDLADHENKVQTARGKAGSLIVFNGSVWHGHTANSTDQPRRSIQGAFVPRDHESPS